MFRRTTCNENNSENSANSEATCKMCEMHTTQTNELYEGMKMHCKYRGVVEVSRVEREFFYVRHRNIDYKQSFSDIGAILFFYKERVQNDLYCKQCSECARIINGDCMGGNAICEYYKQGIQLEKEITDNWPKYGDASYFRFYQF